MRLLLEAVVPSLFCFRSWGFLLSTFHSEINACTPFGVLFFPSNTATPDHHFNCMWACCALQSCLCLLVAAAVVAVVVTDSSGAVFPAVVAVSAVPAGKTSVFACCTFSWSVGSVGKCWALTRRFVLSGFLLLFPFLFLFFNKLEKDASFTAPWSWVSQR